MFYWVILVCYWLLLLAYYLNKSAPYEILHTSTIIDGEIIPAPSAPVVTKSDEGEIFRGCALYYLYLSISEILPLARLALRG